MYKIGIVIPTSRISEQPFLLALISEIERELPSTPIIVVNNNRSIWIDNIRSKNVSLISSFINQGKGAALKAGFLYVLKQFKNCLGVITADADGQHTINDIIRVYGAFMNASDHLLIGHRNFSHNVTPFPQYAGNYILSIVFRLLTKYCLEDTQSGLRAYPRFLIEDIVSLPENKYDFEFVALLRAYRLVKIEIVSINAIYNKNKRSPLEILYRFIPIVLAGLKYGLQ